MKLKPEIACRDCGQNLNLPPNATDQLIRALELLRAVNKTGGVVVELYNGRYLRDWITELLAEIDGRADK